MYQESAILLEVSFVLISAFTACLIFFIIRDFLGKKRTRYNYLLLAMAVCSFGSILMDGISPNEAIAMRLGLDKLPINPALLIANIFINGIFYFEFVVFYILASYFRSLSIIALRPKYENYALKIAVSLSVFLYQLSCILYVVEYKLLISTNYILYANIGGAIYAVTDIYYLVRFIGYMKGSSMVSGSGKGDPKLNIIGKYGSLQSCIFLVMLCLSAVSSVLNNPMYTLVTEMIFVSSTALDTFLFVKMGYELKESTESSAGTKSSKPVSSTKVPAIESVKSIK